MGDTYSVQWPADVTNIMDFYTKMNLDFVSITGVDCLVQKTFYFDFKLFVSLTGFVLFAVFCAYKWGNFLYREKLRKLPRYCVNCGLPVTERKVKFEQPVRCCTEGS